MPLQAETKKEGAEEFAVFRKRLVEWFAREGRQLPWRTKESSGASQPCGVSQQRGTFHQRDPYAVLVSEIMLQQTQVATVIGFFNRWMQRFPDFASLAAAPESEVLHAWQGLGYYSRACNLHRASKEVVAVHGGKLPAEIEALRKLPGLGRYTAGAVATFAFNLPTPIVDANIARVLARLEDFQFPIDAAGGEKALWALAARMQPQPGTSRIAPGQFNEALMELGALVCLPNRPRCEACPVRALCKASHPELLPIKKPAAKLLSLREDCLWVLHRQALLLQRQSGPRWRGLWKLPTHPSHSSHSSHKSLNADNAPVPAKAATRKPKPLLQTTYPFTNHRVTLRVYPGPLPEPSGSLAEGQEWIALERLPEVAIPAPHRRAIEKLLAAGRAR